MKLDESKFLEIYTAMKNGGSAPKEIYKKAFDDGFKRSECMLLIAGLFDLQLNQAREIGHQIYRESLT